MKKHLIQFFKQGLMAAAGGPIILAIIYGILGKTGVIRALTPEEVSTGIFTVALMAFISAGIGVVYQIEQLPLLHASLIHAVILYLDYLLIYLLNNWIPRSAAGIGIFTAIYVAGYGIIWCIILLSIRANITRLNRKLRGDQV